MGRVVIRSLRDPNGGGGSSQPGIVTEHEVYTSNGVPPTDPAAELWVDESVVSVPPGTVATTLPGLVDVADDATSSAVQSDVLSFNATSGLWENAPGGAAGDYRVFATTAARDAALPQPQPEGVLTHLQDLNRVQISTGSAWVNVSQVLGGMSSWGERATSLAGGTAVGQDANANANAVALGKSATTGSHGIAIGFMAAAAGQSGVSIGQNSDVDAPATNGIAIGSGAWVKHAGSMAIGTEATGIRVTTTKTNQLMLGHGLTEVNVPGKLWVTGREIRTAGTTGQVLTFNGTAWAAATPAAGGVASTVTEGPGIDTVTTGTNTVVSAKVDGVSIITNATGQLEAVAGAVTPPQNLLEGDGIHIVTAGTDSTISVDTGEGIVVGVNGVRANVDGTTIIVNANDELEAVAGGAAEYRVFDTLAARDAVWAAPQPKGLLSYIRATDRIQISDGTDWWDYSGALPHIVTLGHSTKGGAGGTAVGHFADASGESGVALGNEAKGTGPAALGIGYKANASSQSAFALGHSSVASQMNAVAVGSTAQSTAAQAVAIGPATRAVHAGSVALGTNNAGVGAATTAINQIQLGGTAHRVDVPGTAFVKGVPVVTSVPGTAVGQVVAWDGTAWAPGTTGLPPNPLGQAAGDLVLTLPGGSEPATWQAPAAGGGGGIPIFPDGAAVNAALPQPQPQGTIVYQQDVQALVISDGTNWEQFLRTINGMISIGNRATIGNQLTPDAPFAIAMGVDSLADAEGAIAIGANTTAHGAHSVVIGGSSWSGNGGTVHNANTIVLGQDHAVQVPSGNLTVGGTPVVTVVEAGPGVVVDEDGSRRVVSLDLGDGIVYGPNGISINVGSTLEVTAEDQLEVSAALQAEVVELRTQVDGLHSVIEALQVRLDACCPEVTP